MRMKSPPSLARPKSHGSRRDPSNCLPTFLCWRLGSLSTLQRRTEKAFTRLPQYNESQISAQLDLGPKSEGAPREHIAASDAAAGLHLVAMILELSSICAIRMRERVAKGSSRQRCFRTYKSRLQQNTIRKPGFVAPYKRIVQIWRTQNIANEHPQLKPVSPPRSFVRLAANSILDQDRLPNAASAIGTPARTHADYPETSSQHGINDGPFLRCFPSPTPSRLANSSEEPSISCELPDTSGQPTRSPERGQRAGGCRTGVHSAPGGGAPRTSSLRYSINSN
jgi:hypothetical protein